MILSVLHSNARMYASVQAIECKCGCWTLSYKKGLQVF